jgi:hypothetical protein
MRATVKRADGTSSSPRSELLAQRRSNCVALRRHMPRRVRPAGEVGRHRSPRLALTTAWCSPRRGRCSAGGGLRQCAGLCGCIASTDRCASAAAASCDPGRRATPRWTDDPPARCDDLLQSARPARRPAQRSHRGLRLRAHVGRRRTTSAPRGPVREAEPRCAPAAPGSPRRVTPRSRGPRSARGSPALASSTNTLPSGFSQVDARVAAQESER